MSLGQLIFCIADAPVFVVQSSRPWGLVLHVFFDVFQAFGSGCFVSACLWLFVFWGLGLGWDGSHVFRPPEPPRSVPGLVWKNGPLLCGTGRIFRVFGPGLGGLWRIPRY